MVSAKLIQGDALESLRALPDASVHCCVTSPPYWGLRDYGTGTWEGGDPDCDHILRRSTGSSTLKNDGRANPGILDNHKVPGVPYKSKCGKCGAIRVDKQIGLEDNPETFIEKLVEVFREVSRVLRDDGTLWVNMGDGYAGSWGAQSRSNFIRGEPTEKHKAKKRTVREHPKTNGTGSLKRTPCLKPKDLIGQPWMLAFALRADGWYLRQDIIWHKPNPMPESTRDRCTKAHEHLFLLSKSRRYYFDQEAIKEPASGTAHARGSGVNPKARMATPAGWATGEGPHTAIDHNIKAKRIKQNESFSAAVKDLVDDRNKRSVWEIDEEEFAQFLEWKAQQPKHKGDVWRVNTYGLSGAHFATYPPKLIEPCIKAGCPKGGTVLDPFSGLGTTGVVALDLGCDYIGIELNPEYLEMTRKRLQPLLDQRRLF